jgi:hypothetical protein
MKIMGVETLIMYCTLWGYILGKIIPLNKTSYIKWWYNRRGIPYFVIFIIFAGKIVHKGLLKQEKREFSYDKGRYLTFKTDPVTGNKYSPTIDMQGESILFYNKGNTNPLEFQDTRITPSFNDPEIFQTIITDNSISQALAGEIDISNLKRFILTAMIIIAVCIAGIMYFLVGM